MTLREYQTEIVDSLRENFRLGHNRQLATAPTGAGKTVLFCFMTKGAVEKGLRVMILAHRSEILDQIDETLRKFGIDAGHIRAGIPMDRTKRVFVASIQTLVKRFDEVSTPDLVIVDECHRAAASQYVQVFARYSKSKFIGVTATPERLDGKGLNEFFGRLVNGPQVQWLIDNGFLKHPIYYAPRRTVDISDVKKTAGDFNKGQLETAMNKPSITGDAVEHYLRLGRNLPAVTFCVTLEHARHVAELFNMAGVKSEVIDGKLSKEDRRAMKARLAGGQTRNMVSCELVSEGFDLPAVGCAILLRPTASLGLHLQQLGRVLRPTPGHPNAVVLDHVGNCQRHGLAEEPREWSLEGHAAKKRKKEAVLDTKQCEKCYAIFQGTKCPQCGTERESGARQIEVLEGELKEIHAAEFLAARNKRVEESKCRTFMDWKTIEKSRGYKNGWAFFRWKASRYYSQPKPAVEHASML